LPAVHMSEAIVGSAVIHRPQPWERGSAPILF